MTAKPSNEELIRDLSRALRAIGFYPQVVLIGGWVPRVYRGMSEFASPTVSSAVTYDIDWAVPCQIKVGEDAKTLDDLLKAEYLLPITSRDREPPVVRYQSAEWGREELAPIYVELLTPLIGSNVGRKGEDRRVQEVQPGVHATALRYLELLLFDPLSTDASAIPDLGFSTPTPIRVPRPAGYMVQKALCADLRGTLAKRNKDLTYIYDVISLTRNRWDDVRNDLDRMKAHHGDWAKWIAKASQNLDRWFVGPRADGPKWIAEELKNESVPPSPEAIRLVMERFRKRVEWI